jgi:ABC-2 type transport system ATP-binding protein
LSTHILSEVEATCDRALVIDRGKLVATGSIAELTARQSATQVAIEVGGDEKRAAKLWKEVDGVAKVQREHRRITISMREGAIGAEVTEALVFALADAKIGVRRVEPLAASLEEVFQKLTRPEREEDV